MPAHLPYEYRYLRAKKKFPHVWCPGCGIGIVMGSIIRAVDALGWKKDDICMVSGIGCTSRMPVYVDFNTLHATHGRALAFATGVKMARPRLNILAVMGDGDGLAIGGNHLIHTARRNIDMTTIIVNNYNYGMTGGQASPTTPEDTVASTAPYGAIEPVFDTCELAAGAGATYVARGTVYHVMELDGFIKAAMAKRGFSIVEVLSPCPTNYGRANRLGSAVKMMEDLRDNTVNRAQAAKLSAEELEGKIVRGVFVDRERPEYLDRYEGLCEKARKAVAGAGQ
ncbi:2-oxoacid:ferredoxin oxidoreductase subunit beta [Candidatus Fermentibacterales bacterium]|nr:2-oxoacid:ferredoxin oxidoreductase subunit beta [Candidatus Fermentibacterales bacterium]